MHLDARASDDVLKETVLSGMITWSAIGKQNMQAKNGP